MAALLVLLLVITGAVFLFMNRFKGDSGIGRHNPVVFLMDTTAPNGVYDDDNKTGGSNAKELYKVLEGYLPPGSRLRPEPLSADWRREKDVIAERPDLVIIHRSSFFHSYNAEFQFGAKTNGFEHPTKDPKWVFLYNEIGDDKLITVLGRIGSEVPHTKFLVYSRGTDPNWLRGDFRAEWVEKIEARWPNLKGRITTMVIPNGYNGSFRQPETRELLRIKVTEILGLPEKREAEKNN